MADAGQGRGLSSSQAHGGPLVGTSFASFIGMPDSLRFLLRSLRSWARTPSLTLVALLTLALGIGANTALFSVLRAVVLAPLPYDDPDSIVRVWEGRPVSSEIFETLAEVDGVFEDSSIYAASAATLEEGGIPRRVPIGRVSAEHFAVLGVEAELGRVFRPSDHEPGGGAVVLSHRFWQQHFAGDRGVLGKSLRLDGQPRIVVGVLPPEHRPIGEDWEIWLPLVIDRTSEAHTDWLAYYMIARLAPGISESTARAACEAALAPLRERYPERLDLRKAVPVAPLREVLVGEAGAMLWLLFAAVVAVLLIACTNVANLMLARLGGRRRELALRHALGASRQRLVAQLLGESMALSLVGGLLGLLVAAWVLAALQGSLTAELPRAESIVIDSGVLVFDFVVALLCGLLFGLLPAWRASRRDAGADLVSAANRGHSPSFGTLRLGAVLVAGEIALAVLLVSGAGLLLKSFWLLQRVDPGFDSSGIQTLRVEPTDGSYDDTARSRFFAQVEEELATLPGVESVGAINLLPLTSGNLVVAYRHADMAADEPFRPLGVRIVTPGYFPTVGVRPLAGRLLEPNDQANGEAVGLVNETLARQLLVDAPGRDVLGREIQFDNGDPWFRVVGIVPNQRHRKLGQEPEPTVYRPLPQETWDTRMVYTLRSSGMPLAQRLLAEAVATIDPGVAVPAVVPFDTIVRRSLGDDQRLTTLFAFFAALALVLGGLGVYGVTAHAVGQRRHEYGVRLALGASSSDVVRGALIGALRPVALGLCLGLPVALLGSSWLAGWLYQVEGTDFSVHAVVVLFLGGCAVLAGWLPARRSARVDPMSILRSD